MEWLIASMMALLDEASAKPTGQFKEFLDERALGLATMLADSRRDGARAADDAAEAMWGAADALAAAMDEVAALNREIVDLTARNVVLSEKVADLETKARLDREHIRELIAEMVRRDVRG